MKRLTRMPSVFRLCLCFYVYVCCTVRLLVCLWACVLGSSGSSVSAGLLASVAPAKRSLSADRQQTWTSATDHHHDNERHEHQQPRPASSSSLSSLQRRTSSSSLSSLSRKCPRLDVMDVSVSVSRRHDNETETDADLQQQQWQPADSTHKSAGTQT